MLLAACNAAAAKIGPPVRGAEPAWSCVEALKAAGSDDFAAGMAKEGALFSRVSKSTAAAAAAAVGGFGVKSVKSGVLRTAVVVHKWM